MNKIVIDWSAYRGPVPGYGDNRPDGGYAVLVPGKHVETHHGPVALPGEDVIYLRIPDEGDRVAGLGGSNNRNLELHPPTLWLSSGPTFGPNAVIYNADDQFTEVTSRAEYDRTSGFRYVSDQGAIIDCQSTYADVARGLYEYSLWYDVAIGQGGKPDMGCVVSFRGEALRRFDPRPEGQRPYPFNARFIRVRRGGPNGLDFAITIVDLDARKTYLCWISWTELYALPKVVASPIPPEKPPIPPVEPPLPTDYLGVNQRVRAKYPTPLGARHWEFIVDLCQQTGTLAYEKNGGAHVLIPPLGKFVSLDVIGRGSLGDNWADTLRDAEGAAIPIWDQHPNAAGTYIDVSGVALPGGPTTPPPTDRVALLEEALRQVERRNDQIQVLSDEIAGIIGKVL